MAAGAASSFFSLATELFSLVQRFGSSPPSSDPRHLLEGDLGKLKTIEQRIQAALHDAEKREVRYEIDKNWLKELKNLAYDLEDVLDARHYLVLQAQVEGKAREAASQKRKRSDEVLDLFDYHSCPTTCLDDILDRARVVCNRYNEISDAMTIFRLTGDDGEDRDDEGGNPPATGSMVDKSSIYGRENEKRDVIHFLLSGNRRDVIVSSICIFGKGGLGKTTLAQLAFNEDRVRDHFNRRGWVCVPPDADITKLTKSILEVLTGEPCRLTELSALQQTLKIRLWQMKVLLVLDNVWDMKMSCWESLIAPLVDAEKVRIIVTTSNEVVSKITQSRLYPLDELPDEECWMLFKHFAFGGHSSNEQPRLAEIGNQIVGKCGRLPLAVKALASLLKIKRDESHWIEVAESELWELDGETDILPALMLSYKYLPSRLKPLFLFCSMFPKDYLFEKEELVRLWMGHNYIQARGRKRVEDVGEEYFDELCRRSLFDVIGTSTKYRMHDVIRNVAQSIAESEIFTVIKKDQVDISEEIRHLYVKGKGEIIESLRFNKPNALRTLLYERSDAMVPKIPMILPKMRCLQHVFSDVSDWCYFSHLIHLRYLRVYNDEIRHFPESLCRLYNLQSLNLDNCENLRELPSGLGNLVNLRFIGLCNLDIQRLPDSICELPNLQKMKLNDCRGIKELPSGIGKLVQLRDLGLCKMDISELPESITQLTNLQVLDMSGCRNLSKLPSCIGNLSNLVTLQVNNTELRELPESFCRLYKLQQLSLLGNWNLRDLPRGFSDLVNLRYLELFDTGNTMFPKCIAELPLRYIKFGTKY